MILLGLLPVVYLVAMVALLWRRDRPAEGVVKAAVVWGATIYAVTELASLARAIRPAVLVPLWLLLAAAAVVLAVRRHRRSRARPAGRKPLKPGPDASERPLPRLRAFLARPLGLLPALTLGLILGVTLLLTLAVAPNTWDAMTYHMSRVMHWQVNGHVDHYPSNIVRQLYMPPLPEYAILHFQVLSGGDRFANLVQWLCAAASLAGAAGVARRLGGGKAAAAGAAIFAATLPLGILESTSTQTDYVVTLWLVALVYFGLASLDQWGWRLAVWQAVAAGLIMATKQTGVFFAAPFLLWQGIVLLRRVRLRAVGHMAAVGVLALAMGLPTLLRNRATFGSFSGPQTTGQVAERIGPGTLVSNLVRHTALQITVSRGVGEAAGEAVTTVHEWLGLDPHDPATTFETYVERKTAWARGYTTHEDEAGNPLHWLLVVVVLVSVLVVPSLRRRRLVFYGLCLVGGVLILSLLLKMTVFRGRYFLPLFVLAGALAGCVAERLGKPWRIALAAALVLWAVPYLFCNRSKPLVRWEGLTVQRSPLLEDRLDHYFYNRWQMRKPLMGAGKALRAGDVRVAGIVTGEDDYEYPLWVILRQSRPKAALRHLVGPDRGEPVPALKARVFYGPTITEMERSADAGVHLFYDRVVRVRTPGGPKRVPVAPVLVVLDP
jgi:hypothetical protein